MVSFGHPMIDLDDRRFLRAEPRLLTLLQHYVALTEQKREDWHGRVNEWHGVADSDLSRWFGRLIASDWLELNESVISKRTNSQIVGSYRATPAGRRVVKELVCEV